MFAISPRKPTSFFPSLLFCTFWVYHWISILFILHATQTQARAIHANPIVRENARTDGVEEPRLWDVNGAGDPRIRGFVYGGPGIVAGGDLDLRIDAGELPHDFEIRIYRLGYYGGKGARRVATLGPFQPVRQPECEFREPSFMNETYTAAAAQDSARNTVQTYEWDCSKWSSTALWSVPADAVSGYYIARPTAVPVTASPPKNSAWRADGGNALPPSPLFADADGTPDGSPRVSSRHAYGALGVGSLREPLETPVASHIYFVVRRPLAVERSAAREKETKESRKATLNKDEKATKNGGKEADPSEERGLHGTHRPDLMIQANDPTWNAYNQFGGRSTYGSYANPSLPRCVIASVHRPLLTRRDRPVNAPLSAEYAFLRWIERSGYDAEYVAGVDVDRFGTSVLVRARHAVVSVGHDEYWSFPQRRAWEQARDGDFVDEEEATGGGDGNASRERALIFLSGNEVFWRVRWDAETRTRMTVFKGAAARDPDAASLGWTGTWRSDPFPDAPGPENALTGTVFIVNAWRADPLIVDSRFAPVRLWRHTVISNMSADDEPWVSPLGILGHEWDADVDNGFRPRGLVSFSETGPIDGIMLTMDAEGTSYDTGSATHHLTSYRAKSGARVFGAGTVQWSYGLDDFHDGSSVVQMQITNPFWVRLTKGNLANRVIQQATTNLLADAKVRPATPDAHVVVDEGIAIPSADTLAPSSHPVAVSAVTDEEVLTNGIERFVHGDGSPQRVQRVQFVDVRATDVGGGVVAAVEVSLDGGATWHPARSSDIRSANMTWRYKAVLVDGDVPLSDVDDARLRTRATDDWLNIENSEESLTKTGSAKLSPEVDFRDEL